MTVNESLNAQSLRQGQIATQVFTISNENDTAAKSAIEIKETQPADSPILKTFTVDIVTDDETQTQLYGPVSFQELVSHGYTTLELLDPHMQRQYRMTFTPAEKVADSFQDTALTYTLRIGTEKTAEVTTENIVENTAESTPVETPIVTPQPEKVVIKELVKIVIPSPSPSISKELQGQVLGTSSSALLPLTQSAQPLLSASLTFFLISGFLTVLLFVSMISMLRRFMHHSRSSLNRQ